MSDIKDMKEKLLNPLPKDAVKKHPTKTYLSSIKAIYVTERFNDVFGVGKWTTKVRHEKTGDKGMIVVHVTFEVPELGIYYESFWGNDNGWQDSKNFDLWDAYKWATTDALTKIGSYLWVGIEVFKGKYNHWNDGSSKSDTDILKEKIEWCKDVSELLSLKDEIETTCVSEKQKTFFRTLANGKYKQLNKWELEWEYNKYALQDF